jgi:hypothetical protein
VLPSEDFEKRLANPFPNESSFLDDDSQTRDVLSLSRVALYPVDARGLTPHPIYSGPYLDDVAAETGGKAFYSTNGLKEAITEVLTTGSHYYTLSYTPTNDNWDDGYRKIKIDLKKPGCTLEYRRSYYARSDAPKIEKHLARTPIGRRSRPLDDSKPRSPKSIVDAMQLGAVAPTQVLFFTDVTAGSGTQKPHPNSQLDSERFLREAYRKKSCRNYLVRYSASPHDLRFAQSPDGRYHASIEYIATVFTDDGAVVNALQSTANLNLDPAQYARAQRDWIGVPLTIAVPTKGTYYLRLGVHDVSSNRAGVVEVPLSEVHPGPSADGIAVP